MRELVERTEINVGSIVRLTYPIPGAAPGTTWQVVAGDACHWYVVPLHYDWPYPSVRVPLRNVVDLYDWQ